MASDQTFGDADEVRVTIPDDEWRAGGSKDGPGDERSHLLMTLVVNGLSMHLEAIEVYTAGDMQVPVQADEEQFAQLHASVNGDGHFETLTIAGREYVLVATPYCD